MRTRKIQSAFPGPWLAAVVALLSLAIFCHGAQAQQTLVIRGSNTFGEELAPALVEQFRKEHPNVKVELESKGSSSGFEALLAGQCDIAASSRPINEDELRLARSRGLKLRDRLIGFYGVTVVVNDRNPVKALSDQQVRDIFTGAVTNWKEVGGEDAAIKVFMRDPVSGTHLGFQELAMERKPYASGAQTFLRYGDILEALRAEPGGVGYASVHLSEEQGVHAVAINGVRPTEQAVNDGTYPYSRSLLLYTVRGKESRAAREFVRFLRSRAGQRAIAEQGFVRVFGEYLWVPKM
jgi:phosphate transport system substrate-binding protein